MNDMLDVDLHDEELDEEITLTAELMAAAAAVPSARLSRQRIDAILLGGTMGA